MMQQSMMNFPLDDFIFVKKDVNRKQHTRLPHYGDSDDGSDGGGDDDDDSGDDGDDDGASSASQKSRQQWG